MLSGLASHPVFDHRVSLAVHREKGAERSDAILLNVPCRKRGADGEKKRGRIGEEECVMMSDGGIKTDARGEDVEKTIKCVWRRICDGSLQFLNCFLLRQGKGALIVASSEILGGTTLDESTDGSEVVYSANREDGLVKKLGTSAECESSQVEVWLRSHLR